MGHVLSIDIFSFILFDSFIDMYKIENFNPREYVKCYYLIQATINLFYHGPLLDTGPKLREVSPKLRHLLN